MALQSNLVLLSRLPLHLYTQMLPLSAPGTVREYIPMLQLPGGAAIGDTWPWTPRGPPLQAARGWHWGCLRKRSVVEVGQADVVPKALPHVHPVIQGIQFFGDVAPD